MKRRSFYVFLAASLAMIIPAPGRFAYGFILVAELNLIMFFGTMFSYLFNKFKLNELSTFATMTVVIGLSVCYKQLINFLYPEAGLTLGFVMYLIPVSIFFTGYLYSNKDGTLGQKLKINMIHILTFSIYAMIIFTVRDVLGYGTFTFFGPHKQLVETVIIPADKVGAFTFLASIPGALILSSLILIHHILVRNKFNILRNSEAAE